VKNIAILSIACTGQGDLTDRYTTWPKSLSEHADAPDHPLAALYHHRQQSGRLATRYFRLADDLLTYLESGQAGGPREILTAMREAEQLRRSALDSVAQLSLVLSHVQQQATAGAEVRDATVHHLALVKGSGSPG